MDPVIVGAVVTVVVSVVNAMVRVAHRRLAADVEIARITEAGQTDRIRCATAQGPRAVLRTHPTRADRSGGGRRGGRPRH
ncbi:hypothetical protein [Streptomyces mangrovisoli]|uniref:hypothetical protein n=1 Tax=Streptomyces mangrovisoli TaxID=1428628 RepID=UPI0009A0C049|nr:hypothetical protein [Streptomyces mangrovisoli]